MTTMYIVTSVDEATEAQFRSTPMPFDTAVELQRVRQAANPRHRVDLVSVDPAQCSPALRWQSDTYPERFDGRVPRRVRMLANVGDDLPWFANLIGDRVITAVCGREYDVYVNSHGAVSAVIDGVMLGIKPNEYEVTAWHNGTNGQD